MRHEADNYPGEGPPLPPDPSKIGWSVIPETPSHRTETPKPAPMPPPAGETVTTAPPPRAAPPEPKRQAPQPIRPEPAPVTRPQTISDDYPGKENLRYLTLPDGLPEYGTHRSPPVTAFKDPLFVPPIARPASDSLLRAPYGRGNQLFDLYKPEKYYHATEGEFLTRLH
ncbi:MAG: hypothetical protein ACRD0P_10860, partial [Stackebrandtia sp.]